MLRKSSIVFLEVLFIFTASVAVMAWRSEYIPTAVAPDSISSVVTTPDEKVSADADQTGAEKATVFDEIFCGDNVSKNTFLSQLLAETNASRKENGKKALVWNETLCESALTKARDMAAQGYFDHIAPRGDGPGDVIKTAGYAFSTAGENLALGYFTAESAHSALMNSPGHRANIISDDYAEVGLAYARGTFEGKTAFFVVEHFASPAPKNPPVRYICETNKAEKQLKELTRTKKKIDEYIKDAEDLKDEYESDGRDTKEIEKYIDDMEKKKKEVKKAIEETEKYLKKCAQ